MACFAVCVSLDRSIDSALHEFVFVFFVFSFILNHTVLYNVFYCWCFNYIAVCVCVVCISKCFVLYMYIQMIAHLGQQQ